ncbi:Uncharacterized protein TCM_031325 [Theobroma cacao]|uniref:Uncharacterized protein n=1 Tax=Theobroma cacao TaxID=3641 RepID=A0A061FE99_THECC|nr:Uncharacterized protein TCM_031325 [Theobroma cacao]
MRLRRITQAHTTDTLSLDMTKYDRFPQVGFFLKQEIPGQIPIPSQDKPPAQKPYMPALQLSVQMFHLFFSI